jgi:HSP20 family molecular chaperone IbpA
MMTLAFNNSLNDLMEELLTDYVPSTNGNYVNSYFDEDNKEHVIYVPAPGFKKDDIEVEVDTEKIRVHGKIRDKKMIKRLGEKEISFYKRYKGIDTETVNAELIDGILEVRFKTNEHKDLKKIKVK